MFASSRNVMWICETPLSTCHQVTGFSDEIRCFFNHFLLRRFLHQSAKLFPCRSGACSCLLPCMYFSFFKFSCKIIFLLVFTRFLYMHQKYSHQCFILFLNTAASFSISWHKQVKNLPHLHQLSSRPRGWRQSSAQYQDKILGFEMVFLPSLKS